jgi:putative transposase
MNRTYGRSGSLWEGRYRSCLVQAEEYLLACYRYIESNPVRAGLCSNPHEYAWSSFAANAGHVFDPSLTPHDVYQALGSIVEERGRAYVALFQSDTRYWRTDEIRQATNGNLALGDERFRRELASVLGRRVERGKPGRPAVPQRHGQADLLK